MTELIMTELICLIFFKIRKNEQNQFNSPLKDNSNTIETKVVTLAAKYPCKQNFEIFSTLSCIFNCS